jgi:dihydroorotate dehydrogenase electron transfer subunit
MPNQFNLEITDTDEIGAGLFQISLYSPELANLAKPGQFLMVDCKLGDQNNSELFLRRPLAVHRIQPEKNIVSILFQIVGQGTRSLAKMVKGDILDVLGPLGNGIDITHDIKRAVFLAGGLGIASLTALMDLGSSKGINMTLLAGARNSWKLYPSQLLPKGVVEITATDDGSAGVRAPVTHLLSQVQSEADIIYACGPIGMLRTLSNMREEGLLVTPTVVLLESPMGCGIGICKGCVVDTTLDMKLICVDGPAFDLEDIKWDSDYSPR